MVEIKNKVLVQVNDEIRDIINWISVFEDEYNLPAEVVDELKKRLEDIAAKLG